MNISDYLKQKLAIKILEDKKNSSIRKKCYFCFRPQKNCFCRSLKSFDTFCSFVILMHPMEAKKIKIGTARLANVCLNNCQMIEGVNFSQNKQVNALINDPNYFPMVLYPGERSHDLSRSKIDKDLLKKRRPLFFIIDGTWPCAKIIMRESKNIQNLMRVSFSTNELSKFSIKHQPSKFCLSTIESIFYLLSDLNKWDYEHLTNEHDELLRALKLLVDFQVECAANPNLTSYRRSGAFKNVSLRKQNKKWSSRSICYEDKNYKNSL